MRASIVFVLLHYVSLVCGKAARLTDADFDAVLVEHEFALVSFVAPGCAQCDKLAPAFDTAADLLLSEKPPVFLAEIDCARFGLATCANLDIDGYPTLKVFRQGKTAFKYEGPQDAADSIVKYMQSLVRPLSTELNSVDDVETFRDHPDHGVIGFFAEKDSVIFERFHFFASTLNDRYRFAHTFNIDVRNFYGFNNTFFIYRSPRQKTTFEPDQLEYRGVYSPYKMRDWLLANIHGFVGHRTRETASDFRYPLVVLYYDVDYVKNAKSSNYWRNRAMKVAKTFVDAGRTVTFAVSNTASFRHELEELGLAHDIHGDKPLVVGRDENRQAYVMESEFTSELFEKFVESFLQGTLKPVIRADVVRQPAVSDSPVKTSDDKTTRESTFEKIRTEL